MLVLQVSELGRAVTMFIIFKVIECTDLIESRGSLGCSRVCQIPAIQLDFTRVKSTRSCRNYWLVITVRIIDYSIGTAISTSHWGSRVHLYGARQWSIYGLVTVNHERIFLLPRCSDSNHFSLSTPLMHEMVYPKLSLVVVCLTSICSNITHNLLLFRRCSYVLTP